MVWAPNYGGGYSFIGGCYISAVGTADFTALDINGDASLIMADDSYALYYLGDDAVDWVGMFLYHWGGHYSWGANAVLELGKFVAMLIGQYWGSIGDETAVFDFYGIFAGVHHKLVAIIETAVFFVFGRLGDELAIKQSWWRQVFDGSIFMQFSRLAMINWFEWDKYEVEVKALVNWTVIRRFELASAFVLAFLS